MDGDALIMMLIGMIIIWGGFAASVAHALKVARKRRDDQDKL